MVIGNQTLQWIAWNLMLAAIPVVIAYPLAMAMDRWTVKKRKLPWAVWFLPVLVWMAFLPNTCYLISEWRHFLFDAHFVTIREDASANPYLMLRAAKQSLFFLGYSAIGVLMFALAIRPVHRVLKKAKFRVAAWAPAFFLLVSLGVYMGLIVRLNSWDLVKRPGYVFQTALHAFTTPALAQAVLAFAALLWLLYGLVDMWVDGFMLRMKK